MHHQIDPVPPNCKVEVKPYLLYTSFKVTQNACESRKPKSQTRVSLEGQKHEGRES